MTVTDLEPARMGAFDERDDNLIRYLGLNPNSPADRAAVAVCRHYGFDPLLKHVVVIPKSGLYITRDGLLSVAHRSGQLDGIVVECDPVLDESGDWVAKVSVWRKDMSHPFTYPGRYPADGTNRQYAPEMALKAAEAHALRRAFDVGGLPTLDERRPDPAPRRVSAADILDKPEPTPEPRKTKTARRKLVAEMFAILGEVGLADPKRRDDRLTLLGAVAGRPLTSSDDLDEDELNHVAGELLALHVTGRLQRLAGLDGEAFDAAVTDILNEHALAQENVGGDE